jgi:Caspase domain/TIR domain
MEQRSGSTGSSGPPGGARRLREWDVFLSYNKKDLKYLQVVKARLTGVGISAWLDEDDMQQGGNLSQDLIAGLRRCKTVAVFFGTHDIGKYGRRELEVADVEDIKRKLRVFPVLLPGYDSKEDLSEVEPLLSTKTVVNLGRELDQSDISKEGLVQLAAAIWHESSATAAEKLAGIVPGQLLAPAGPPAQPGSGRPEPTGRHRALLIGIGRYEDRGLQNLHGPPADVGHLAEALKTLTFDADAWDVRLLMDPNRDEFVTALTDAYKPAGSDDVHLLYFSGHGVVPPSGEVYLCLRDTDPSQPDDTAYRLGGLESRARTASGEHVLIFDCCHAAPLDQQRGPFHDVDQRAAVFSASHRAVSDAPAADHTSPFTTGLVDCLRSYAGLQVSTAELRVDLERRGAVRCNVGFADAIVLGGGRPEPYQRIERSDAISLRFGTSRASLYRQDAELSCSEDFPPERLRVLGSLVSLLDALLAAVDREHLLDTPVALALETAGQELAAMTLPGNLLDLVGHEEAAWRQWELAFGQDPLELAALPWELLGPALVRLAGLSSDARVARTVSVDQARKSGGGPVRNVALFNSLDAERAAALFAESPSFASTAKSELDKAEVGAQRIEPATFLTLSGLQSGTHDAAAFFVPVRRGAGGPELWLRDTPEELGWTGVGELPSSLLRGLTCIVVETLSENPAQASHRATRELAGLIAQAAAVSVVAVCHPLAYLEVYRQRPATFTGAFITGLQHDSLHDAAAGAREKLLQGLRSDDRVLVGSPVVVKVLHKPAGEDRGGRRPIQASRKSK